MAVTTSSLLHALHEIRLDEIFDTLFKLSDDKAMANLRIYPMFKKKKMEGQAKDEKKFTIQVGYIGGLYPHTEGADVVKDDAISFAEGTITAKPFSGGFNITREATEKAKARGVNGIASYLEWIRKSIIRVFDLQLDLFFASPNSDGSGKVAQVNGAVSSSTTITVDNPGVVGGNFWVGMRIDIHNGTSYQATDAKVVDVDPINNQITVDSAVTVDDNAWIYLHNAKDSMFDGLMSIVSDSTFQGLNPSTYSFWKALLIDETGTTFSEDMLDKDIRILLTKGAGAAPNLIILDPETKEALNKELKNDRVIDSPTTVGGMKVRTVYVTDFGEIPIVVDRFFTSQKIMLVNTDDIFWADFVPIEWIKDNSGSFNILDNKIDYEAKYFGWFNPGATRRNSHALVTGYSLS